MDPLINIQIMDFPRDKVKTFGAFAGRVATPDYYECVKNERMFSRLFYIQQGEIVFDRGTDKMVSAPAGTIVYLPNNITYRSEWLPDRDGKYIAIHFIVDETFLRLPDHICIAARDKNSIYLEMFRKAYEIWKNGAPGYKLELLAELYKILHRLFLDSNRSEIKSKYQTVYRGILYIENHYLEEINVGELAAMCCVSESSFRRLFKEYKKMSPITYKNYLRIKRARELLLTGEYNVTEAANAVNIPDLCYFCKLFKRFTGRNPGEFILKE